MNCRKESSDYRQEIKMPTYDIIGNREGILLEYVKKLAQKLS